MTHLERLTAWQATHAALVEQSDALCALTDSDYDSPMLHPVWKCFEAYTALVSETVGDRSGWLNWYAYECECGKNPKEAEIDGEFRTVSTVKDLLWCIGTSRLQASTNRAGVAG